MKVELAQRGGFGDWIRMVGFIRKNYNKYCSKNFIKIINLHFTQTY